MQVVQVVQVVQLCRWSRCPGVCMVCRWAGVQEAKNDKKWCSIVKATHINLLFVERPSFPMLYFLVSVSQMRPSVVSGSQFAIAQFG